MIIRGGVPVAAGALAVAAYCRRGTELYSGVLSHAGILLSSRGWLGLHQGGFGETLYTQWSECSGVLPWQ